MSKKKKVLDWVVIKNEYLTTSISYRKLCDKYRIPFNTLKSRAGKEEWSKEKKDIQHKINTKTTQKIVEIVIDEKVNINKRHSDLYDKGLDVVEFYLNYYLDELEKFKRGEIKKTKASPYSLDFLMNSIQKGQKGQRLANNMENEDNGSSEPEILIIDGVDLKKI